MQARLVLLILLLLAGNLPFAQDVGTVRGVVTSEKDGNAIPFAKVVIIGPNLFAQTDVDGFFSIPKVPTGSHEVRITVTGFTEATETVEVVKGKISEIKLELMEGTTLTKVDVTYKNKERKFDPGTSIIKITKKDILRVPVTGGVSDIAGYFQTVPGVITTGDQGGQVYVRGGTPIQNKILLDGMTIYNPFHSIGFFSVFETELIRSADIYTGGFSAKYGGRISSIMDITYRDGNSKRLSGMVGISPFTSSLLLEGPISKKNGISFVMAGKASLLEETSKVLYPYINEGDGLPFNFWDLYGKVSIKGEGANRISLFGFSFNDQVTYQAVSNLGWNSFGGGMNFIFVPQSSELFMKGRINYSQYDIVLQEENLEDRFSGINGTEMAFDFTYHLQGKNKIEYGFAFNLFNTKFETFNEANRSIKLEGSTIEAGGYVSHRRISKNKRFILEPSFRFQGYGSVGQVTAEPRMSAKINVTEKFRFKGAGGRYTQNFTSTTSDRDVVNLFYGFITAPSNIPDRFVMEDGTEREVKNGLQKAWHAVAGFELDITKKLSFQVEGYYKWFTQMSNINNNKIFEDTDDNSEVADEFKKDFIVESGEAMGVDFLFEYSSKKLYIWAVYSLGKVTRWNGFDTYAPVFDRRHNVNLVGSYILDKKEEWEINARWNLGTGFPFKQTNGVYEVPEINAIDEDYWTNNPDDLTFLYEEGNTGRLPTYHRLDINLKKKFNSKKWKHLKWEVIAGVTNVYSRNNIFYVNRVTNEKVYQLPIMPSLAVSMKF